MQPTLAYFLRNRLNELGQTEVRSAIETAFREHYNELGGMLNQLLRSKEPRERQVGQLLTGLEYENLVAALNLALTEQISIAGPYNALFRYFDTTQNPRRGLELYQSALERFEQYPTEKLSGTLGIELINLLGTIANWQLDLKLFLAAGYSYQKLLTLVQSLVNIDEKIRNNLRASAYHQLGMVAEEQRQWQQAEQYYQQALQIFIDYNDRYEQADSYYQLGMVAEKQQQWQQAEIYLQQALQIRIEYNDRHKQADAYIGLGSIAHFQQQYTQAEHYYKQALQIYFEYNNRYYQAGTYHNLGLIATDQEQWQQAEAYLQQALQIRIEYNDRHGQASTYHQLGRVAQEQRQWQQAEQYYQQALQIKIEYNDRYSQASTYGQLGLLAQEQQQLQQAGEYLLRALQIFKEYKDNYSVGITLRNLARLWNASDDVNVRASIAKALGKSVEETEKMLREALEKWEEEQTGGGEKKE